MHTFLTILNGLFHKSNRKTIEQSKMCNNLEDVTMQKSAPTPK